MNLLTGEQVQRVHYDNTTGRKKKKRTSRENLNTSYHFAPPERRVWIFLKGSQSHCQRTFWGGGGGGGGLWTPEDSLSVLVWLPLEFEVGRWRCWMEKAVMLLPVQRGSLSLSLRDGDTVLLLLLLLHRSVTLGLGFFPFFPSLDAHARPLLVLRWTDSRDIKWRHVRQGGRGRHVSQFLSDNLTLQLFQMERFLYFL